MNLNSPLFDRIRTKPAQPQQQPVRDGVRCDHPGCAAAGEHRAPMGRAREGQYFCFCLDHVREYNASYNYFNGMTDDDVARYQRDASTGHRPTWAMGVNRSGRVYTDAGVDPLGMHRTARASATPEAPKSRYGLAARKALTALGLDENVDAAAIRARYKDLVKRLHPDANGGDRSSEDKLREIIQAYKYLRSAKLA